MLSDLRSSQKGRSIPRLRSQHGLDDVLGGPKISSGLVHLAQALLYAADSLHASHQEIGIGNLESQLGVSPHIGCQPPQVLERSVDDQLPDFGAPGQLADLSIDIEELVRQLADILKSPLGERALAVGYVKPHR